MWVRISIGSTFNSNCIRGDFWRLRDVTWLLPHYRPHERLLQRFQRLPSSPAVQNDLLANTRVGNPLQLSQTCSNASRDALIQPIANKLGMPVIPFRRRTYERQNFRGLLSWDWISDAALAGSFLSTHERSNSLLANIELKILDASPVNKDKLSSSSNSILDCQQGQNAGSVLSPTIYFGSS